MESPGAFWSVLWRFVGLKARREADRAVDGLDRMPGARWFPGAELNFAENLLQHAGEREALVSWSEDGRRRSVSYEALRRETGALASALASAGVRRGDRVGGFVANVPETVAAMLAATSLGAIWTACSPDFGAEAAADRFGQTRPKILFAVDGYRYGGAGHGCLAKVAEIARRVDSIERVIVIPCLSEAPGTRPVPSAILYGDFLASPRQPRFEPLPFDHPTYILYTSGTTGPPKCIVHGAGGTLLQHRKEHALHSDLGPGDKFFYYTSCAWMMWNWLVSGLAAGATLVLYDGSPFHPSPRRLFDMAEAEGVSVFGAGAKYYSAIEKAGLEPARSHRLPALRTILSTGSPLADESFDYVYGAVKPDVLLASISGGTDIVSCFALGNPVAPVYRGELQAPGLGMRVEVFGDGGKPLPAGEKGELVCTLPFPSMPVGFWNDPDGSGYRAAYFERFPGAWCHGDYCERTASGGFRIWGRSDAVLNPGGVRIGTAEIYGAVEALSEIAESLAVGWQDGSDERVVLFVKLAAPGRLDAELAGRIRRAVRQRASPRHAPDRIFAIPDIPRTRSGKIAELAVKNALHGRPAGNENALANPEALEAVRQAREGLADCF